MRRTDAGTTGVIPGKVPHGSALLLDQEIHDVLPVHAAGGKGHGIPEPGDRVGKEGFQAFAQVVLALLALRRTCKAVLGTAAVAEAQPGTGSAGRGQGVFLFKTEAGLLRAAHQGIQGS